MVVNKSKSAFRTIAEVAEELGVATHVLRFWETKFSQIKPMKASGGRRYYRPDDVEVVRVIKSFLYEKRYTIEGVQKLFKDKGLKAILGGEIQKDFFEIEDNSSTVQVPENTGLTASQKQILTDAYNELKQIEEELKKYDIK